MSFKFPWSKQEEPALEPEPEQVPLTKQTMPMPGLKQRVDEPKSTGIFGFLFSPMPKLPNPGKYEELNRESKSIIGTQEIFDGFHMDFSKGFNENFSSSHSIGLGSVMEPPSYNFGTSYVNGPVMMWGRIDTDGHLIGRYQHAISDNLILRVGGQATNEPHNSGMNLEVDYKGDDYYAQFKWSNPGTYGVSYMQSITPTLALGCDAFYTHKQGLTMVTVGGRHETEKSITSVVMTTGHLTASYTHKVNEKVGLSTECMFQQTHYGFESLWSLGYEYRLRMSLFRGHIDSAWKVAGTLEEAINQNTKFVLCGELDHKKKQYRFGIGFQMQL